MPRILIALSDPILGSYKLLDTRLDGNGVVGALNGVSSSDPECRGHDVLRPCRSVSGKKIVAKYNQQHSQRSFSHCALPRRAASGAIA